MKIALMAAMAENRTVGINNALPWHLPEDLKYFKRTTSGKAIIMGRKTYESIGRPLPNRTNIVISRNPNFQLEGVRIVSSLDDAIELAESVNEINGIDEVMVIGGAAIYELALPKADRLYLTHVHADVHGDAFFPEVDFNQFTEISRDDFFADDKNPYDYSFVIYDRI
ncbi:type 3 dihydrofolate reductase [Bermanella marisrubri]|uniref:Dihydrofolate reductase n=1 Tax=Bermanella marisrubri TaxID=207949 RepID=Q1MYJ4_9GAMM|nr:type 3 dihydrofolate reductase [Bermanella marisrubri]EAT11037.1 Dihydrofolate reductase [Oceanobacter sp. RED65] [Bermanella marisrubri]QIZ82976.1 type 3 dihydrofolate reductase [Bermanella marisrubri]